jgi:hypothetical protein
MTEMTHGLMEHFQIKKLSGVHYCNLYIFPIWHYRDEMALSKKHADKLVIKLQTAGPFPFFCAFLRLWFVARIFQNMSEGTLSLPYNLVFHLMMYSLTSKNVALCI